MLEIILLIVVCFFSGFGAAEFFKWIYCHDNKCKKNILTVIPLKNDEQEAEKIIRCCIYGGVCDNIFLVDYNSNDKTAEIANRLQNQYDGITTYNVKQFTNFIKGYYND